MIRGNANELLAQVDTVSTDPEKLKKDDPDRAIGMMEKDGEYVFWYDTPSLGTGEFNVFWGLRETAVSSMEYDHQLIRVPHWTYWSLDKSLRMIIDKLQKKMGWVQSYSNDQTLEYILQGIGMVNQVMPATSWQLNSIPTMMDASSGVADAIITAATIIAPMMNALGLNSEMSRALAVLAVGAGAMTVSHINDSYFWVVSQFSGMNTKTTLKSHTVATLIQGVTAILLLSLIQIIFN